MGGIELDLVADQEWWLRKGVSWSNYRKDLTKLFRTENSHTIYQMKIVASRVDGMRRVFLIKEQVDIVNESTQLSLYFSNNYSKL